MRVERESFTADAVSSSRPWLGRVQKGGSVAGAFLFGAAFGLGWTPCIGPVPLIAVAEEPSPSGAACTPEPGGDATCALPEEPSFHSIKPAVDDALPLAGVARPTMVEFISESCTV